MSHIASVSDKDTLTAEVGLYCLAQLNNAGLYVTEVQKI